MSDKIIDEVMGLVQSLRLSEQMQDLEAVGQCEEAIRTKLREELDKKPLSDEQIEKATGAKIGHPLFLAAKGFVIATERAHNIGAE